MRDVPELLVLHTLRLTGVAELDVLASRLSVGVGELRPVLEAYSTTGLVTCHSGRLPGWALTTTGRQRGEELASLQLDELGVRGSVEAGYGQFLELNSLVIEVCADWQVVAGTEPMALNDHLDGDYDAGILTRLGGLHIRALGMLSVLSADVERFGSYGDRLGNALARARDGGVDWVTKPVIDSYHSVWFELHEDLLATLGHRRSEERRWTGDAQERTEQGERR